MNRRRYDYEPIDPIWSGIWYGLLFSLPLWAGIIEIWRVMV